MVGTAYVRLRLLTDSIGKDIEKSVKKSDLQDIDIKVDADTGKAALELDKLGVKSDELARKSPTITPKVDTKQAKKETSLLKDALVLLGPTIGPLGAVAAGAFGVLAASAGTAVLAVQGVKKEMTAGTVTGVKFTAGIQTLKADLSTLEATTARGVLPGFQATVTALNASLPGVNHSVGNLSQILGDIGAHVVVGLVSGLQTFEPLLTHIGIEADTAAGHFQSWATGPGGAKFAEALGEQFDQVVPVLAHLTEAVGRLIAAFTPIGDHIVGIIGALADAINAIPIPVLQTLASVFVTLYTANRLNTIFQNLSVTLTAFGARAGVTSIALGTLAVETAGFTAALGPLAAALGGGYIATQVFGDQLDKIANKFATGKILKSVSEDATGDLNILSNALIDVGGSADASAAEVLRFALSGKLVGQGLGEISDKAAALASDFTKFGATSDQVTTAVGGSDAVFNRFIDTIQKHGGATKQDIDTLGKLHDAFKFTVDSTNATRDALAALTNDPAWKNLDTSTNSVAQVAAKFNLSSSAVTQYASLLGISSDAIKNGVITNAQLAASVQTVSTAYNTATATGAGFLDSLQKFSTSAGTAADRAQLIGSYLKAAQGDLLGYQGAVASAYQANLALTNSFKQQADQVKAGTLAITDTEKAAINLKTGLIDVSKAGAGPLIQQLQAMQDAAMNAAEATYQHERATKGAGVAAADAAKIFQNQTFNALVNDAKQLGLTTKQAENLAKSYFDLPKDVATKVKAIGTDPVITVLNKIQSVLLSIAHMSPHPTISVRDHASTQISKVQQNLLALRDKTINIDTYVRNVILPTVDRSTGRGGTGEHSGGHYGGLVGAGKIEYRSQGGPAGRVTGPPGRDRAGLFALENGEWVTDRANTSRYLPLLQAIGRGQVSSVSGVSGASAGGGVDTAAILAGIQALASALANRPVQLVAEDGGLVMARVVNNANLKNARRLGVGS